MLRNSRIQFLPEDIDDRIDPADSRIVDEELISALQRAEQKMVIRVEKVDRVDRVPGAKNVFNPRVARRTQPAIGVPDVMHAPGRRRGKIETGLMGLNHRATIIDDDDDKIDSRVLVECSNDGLAEQYAMLVNRNDDGERRLGAASGCCRPPERRICSRSARLIASPLPRRRQPRSLAIEPGRSAPPGPRRDALLDRDEAASPSARPASNGSDW